MPSSHVKDGTSGAELAKRKRSEVIQRLSSEPHERHDISDINVDHIAETTISESSHRTKENGNISKNARNLYNFFGK